MKTLLRIDSSSRLTGSHSRSLADEVESAWKDTHADGKVIYRDLVTSHIPHINADTIEGFHTPDNAMDQRLRDVTALSDQLIAELKQADDILISSPLYNLNVPSRLKAWIDQVTRQSHTFSVDASGNYSGLLNHKKAYLILARGGNLTGTDMEYLDFQKPYLQAILTYMGIKVHEVFMLDGSAHPELLETNLHAFKNEIKDAFQTLNIEL